MPKYDVTVQEMSFRTATVQVEAESDSAAQADALKQACDGKLDFFAQVWQADHDYEVVSWKEAK